MIILCSDLPSDQDLIKALDKDAFPMSLFTDACFSGVGAGGAPLLVAVERKKVPDVAACINDGRLLQQMRRVKDNNADVFVLIVEGDYRCGHGATNDGLLITPHRPTGGLRFRFTPIQPPMLYSRFEQYLFELDWLVGAVVRRSNDVGQTADIIRALYINFQTEPSHHQSLHTFYQEPLSPVLLQKPSLVRRVAKELDGIGWGKSKTVDEHFSSVKAMCEADAGEWSKLPGIGKKTAKAVVEALRGEGEHA